MFARQGQGVFARRRARGPEAVGGSCAGHVGPELMCCGGTQTLVAVLREQSSSRGGGRRRGAEMMVWGSGGGGWGGKPNRPAAKRDVGRVMPRVRCGREQHRAVPRVCEETRRQMVDVVVVVFVVVVVVFVGRARARASIGIPVCVSHDVECRGSAAQRLVCQRGPPVGKNLRRVCAFVRACVRACVCVGVACARALYVGVLGTSPS